MTDAPERVADPAQNQNAERRGFLADAMSLVVWGIISLFSVAAGLIVFLDPLNRKPRVPKLYRRGSGEDDEFIRIANMDVVPANGMPQRFPVIANRLDAWNFSPDQPIGAVWVVRDADNQIEVFHTTCPHAGCAVAFDRDSGYFACPCHNSVFDVNGQKVDLPGRENPSPRPMDKLAWTTRDGNLFVKFQNYYPGIHEQKPKL